MRDERRNGGCGYRQVACAAASYRAGCAVRVVRTVDPRPAAGSVAHRSRQEQRRIFYQFERGRAAIDSKAKGSGLGLAITRAIVNAHGGRVELRSRPGEGAEFRIRLRRMDDGSSSVTVNGASGANTSE